IFIDHVPAMQTHVHTHRQRTSLPDGDILERLISSCPRAACRRLLRLLRDCYKMTSVACNAGASTDSPDTEAPPVSLTGMSSTVRLRRPLSARRCSRQPTRRDRDPPSYACNQSGAFRNNDVASLLQAPR